MSASVLGESRRQAGRLSEEGASLVKEIQPAQAGFVYVARPFRGGGGASIYGTGRGLGQPGTKYVKM
ncbi:MAG: hypothetical protein GDA43_11300 [Hormoscilla sp. SP5CHS1]|nr:hypothetical protein [Hormoscilla sp. SP12CHS1]MBC6453721.1 hypothetical protein [Hormoscilla sp. SP5CHS1]